MNNSRPFTVILKESWDYLAAALSGKTNLLNRVRAILTRPGEEWEIIETEQTSVSQVFSGYALVLILVPSLSEFIRVAVFHDDIVTGLSGFVNNLLLNMLVVFGLAKVIEWMAPSLFSESDYRKSFQLVVYSLTPFWLFGATNLFFSRKLIILFLAWFYSGYILKKGMPLLKKTPPENATGFFVLTILVMVFGTFLVSTILDLIF